MEPKQPAEKNVWEMIAYCDSDYDGDKNGRKIVTGFVIYILWYLVSWKSRSQKLVTLSSTEAEYYSI